MKLKVPAPVKQPATSSGRFGFQPAAAEAVRTLRFAPPAPVLPGRSLPRSRNATQSGSQKARQEESQMGSDGSDSDLDTQVPPHLSSDDPDLRVQQKDEVEVRFPRQQLREDDDVNESDLDVCADVDVDENEDADHNSDVDGYVYESDVAGLGLRDIAGDAVSSHELSDMECDNPAVQVNSKKVRVHVDNDKVNTHA